MCEKAIALCIRHESLYLLAELHYQIGEHYKTLREKEKAKTYMEKSLALFELIGQHELAEPVRHEIKNFGGS